MTDTATKTTTWTIDAAHSAVEFAIKHMMFATVRGRFAEVSGQIEIDNDDITNSSVSVEIPVASVDTHDEGRDNHLKSADFFDAESFSTITFTSTGVEAKGDDLAVTGDLTIRGVTKSVVLATEKTGEGVNPWGARVIGFSASTKISRKEFGLNWNAALETGGVLVGDEVKITLDIEANA